MKEITKVVVDAMGGDNAPHEIIKGAVEAVGKSDAIHVILVGKEDVINQELSGYTYNKEQISVVHTSEVIETAEPPVMAIRRKKDSSIVVGLKMVKDKEADAFVSAGSSGAVLAGGQLLVGRIKGVERPPLATADSDRKRIFHFDRLWGECRCKTFTSGAVCQDGFDLYGTYYGSQESEGCDRQYRS